MKYTLPEVKKENLKEFKKVVSDGKNLRKKSEKKELYKNTSNYLKTIFDSKGRHFEDFEDIEDDSYNQMVFSINPFDIAMINSNNGDNIGSSNVDYGFDYNSVIKNFIEHFVIEIFLVNDGDLANKRIINSLFPYINKERNKIIWGVLENSKGVPENIQKSFENFIDNKLNLVEKEESFELDSNLDINYKNLTEGDSKNISFASREEILSYNGNITGLTARKIFERFSDDEEVLLKTFVSDITRFKDFFDIESLLNISGKDTLINVMKKAVEQHPFAIEPILNVFGKDTPISLMEIAVKDDIRVFGDILNVFGKDIPISFMEIAVEDNSGSTLKPILNVFGKDTPISLMEIAVKRDLYARALKDVLKIFGKDTPISVLEAAEKDRVSNRKEILDVFGKDTPNSVLEIWVQVYPESSARSIIKVFGKDTPINILKIAFTNAKVKVEFFRDILEIFGKDTDPELMKLAIQNVDPEPFYEKVYRGSLRIRIIDCILEIFGKDTDPELIKLAIKKGDYETYYILKAFGFRTPIDIMELAVEKNDFAIQSILDVFERSTPIDIMELAVKKNPLNIKYIFSKFGNQTPLYLVEIALENTTIKNGVEDIVEVMFKNLSKEYLIPYIKIAIDRQPNIKQFVIKIFKWRGEDIPENWMELLSEEKEKEIGDENLKVGIETLNKIKEELVQEKDKTTVVMKKKGNGGQEK